MRFTTILAAVGTTAVLVLGVPVAASASPQAPVHQTRAVTIYPADEVRTACWDPSPYYDSWDWSQAGQIYNADEGGNCYDYGQGFEFVFGPCAAPPNQGYCSLTEVYEDIAGIWQNTGNCGGWSASLQRIVKQSCNGASYQYWAGTGGRPDLIWNMWVQQNYPHVCPISGGYTQQVITSDSNNGAVYLSCPQGAGGQSYLAKQMWYLAAVIIP